MNKLFARFEYKINEKLGLFLLDHDTQIAEAKEMAFAFLKYLGQIEDMAKAQQESQNPVESAVIEESKVEELPEVVNV
jgi:hypothetical protein